MHDNSVARCAVLFSALAALLSAVLSAPTGPARKGVNDRPIIGILSQAVFPASTQFGESYIAASYVKYIESAGARVVPIRNDLSDAELKTLFSYLNGVLFPGGAVDLKTSGYAKAARLLFDLALKANDNNDYFPIWGTCLGFEELSILISGENLLTHTNTSNNAMPLVFTKDAKESRLFRNFPTEVMHALKTKPITANFHHWSLSTKNFTANEKLKSFYRVISVNTDSTGVEFISTMEAFKYPVYGVQWHPEKNPFEWSIKLQNPHSIDAIRAAFYMGDFFVNEARKNFHKFPTEAMESKALIYNYNAVYTGNISTFSQKYFFNHSEPHQLLL
ncbi:gamma-glutamyl hydrolase-like [Lethenteron reissneri]|uniref:gamma-glutamyl hydrolase-like n=1 Tax=Lethenteron reissneri TaxID=7753 RepID=UPI002AB7C123|nr:gamma-glutamyl hydrolase-like [Lethenteron reissneri]